MAIYVMANGGMVYKDIAVLYGISETMIGKIVRAQRLRLEKQEPRTYRRVVNARKEKLKKIWQDRINA